MRLSVDSHKCHRPARNHETVTLLSSSPYRTGLPPSEKVWLGGGESVKQLSTSTMFLRRRKATRAIRQNIPSAHSLELFNRHWLGEVLERAEGDHGSHALTGRREGRVEQNVADAGHVRHAVVVQVGRERHPAVPTGEGEFICTAQFILAGN